MIDTQLLTGIYGVLCILLGLWLSDMLKRRR